MNGVEGGDWKEKHLCELQWLHGMRLQWLPGFVTQQVHDARGLSNPVEAHMFPSANLSIIRSSE